jgi:hypothetical protein
MKKVLYVGQEPDTVDFNDPALPAGMNAEKIRKGIDAGMKQLTESGWDADYCSIRPDGSAPAELERCLKAKPYDCVVIGAGIRIPTKSLLLFESIVNTIHRSAPQASIAFNTSPEDTAHAVARLL